MRKELGEKGRAYATFFSYLLMDLLAYLINIRVYTIPYEWIRILRIISVTVLLLFIFGQINVNSWQKELLYKLSTLLFYPLLLCILGFFAPGELKRVKDFIFEILEKLKLKKAYRLIFNKMPKPPSVIAQN